MADQETQATTSTELLILLSRTIKFASDHPYAATGIFGAAIGSAVTYQVVTRRPAWNKVTEVFTPKVYEFPIAHADLRRMLTDPTAEVRWELPDMSVIITAEKRKTPKQLPIVDTPSIDIE